MDSASVRSFERVDFYTDETILDDPYPFFEYVRAEKGPVWIDPNYNVAFVTGYEEVVEVLREVELYSSCNAPTGPFPGLPVPVEGDDANPVIEAHREELPMHEFMVTMDPPQHSEYRGLLRGLFTPRRLKENEDFMWRLADAQIDRFFDRGSCEVIQEYAVPFTGLVIADLLGVPEADLGKFRQVFEGQTIGGVGEGEQQILADNPLAFFEQTFSDYVVERREQPRQDVLTALARGVFSDGSVPAVDILAREASFIFAAGQETTVRLIGFALQHLGEHPDVQQGLRDERALIPTFVEEMLRLESPIKAYFRLARRTTTLGGVRVPAGTTVMILAGACNRDPRQFEDPHEFRLDRANVREHIAFSRGVHSCLGQPLARSETRITLERMFDRMGDIRISEEHHGPAGERSWKYLPTWLFRGLDTVNVTFAPTT